MGSLRPLVVVGLLALWGLSLLWSPAGSERPDDPDVMSTSTQMLDGQAVPFSKNAEVDAEAESVAGPNPVTSAVSPIPESSEGLDDAATLRVNVGRYIDPEALPPSSGRAVNVGSFIDPEELPVYPSREINVGAYIDPETLPPATEVRVNYGAYMDPEAPKPGVGSSANSGPALSGPTP
jgi:hypothetical protein